MKKDRITEALEDYNTNHSTKHSGKISLRDTFSILDIAKEHTKEIFKHSDLEYNGETDYIFILDIAFKSAYAIGYKQGIKDKGGIKWTHIL